MRAVVWHGIGDIRLDEVSEPTIQDPHDAIVQVTRSAICGTDLHFVRGTVAPMKEGEILGPEDAAAFDAETRQIAPDSPPDGFGPGRQWKPGNAPSLVSRWSVDAVAKYGRLSIMGVYSPREFVYPIGQAMNKNLTVRMGNCDHHRVTPQLIDMVAAGQFDPTRFVTQREPLASVIDAYRTFDLREDGWLKVEISDLSS